MLWEVVFFFLLKFPVSFLHDIIQTFYNKSMWFLLSEMYFNQIQKIGRLKWNFYHTSSSSQSLLKYMLNLP